MYWTGAGQVQKQQTQKKAVCIQSAKRAKNKMTFSKQRSLFFLLADAFNFKWSHMVTLVMAPVRSALYIHSKNRKSSLCTHSAKTAETK